MAQLAADLINQLFSITAGSPARCLEAPRPHWIQCFQAQIFKLHAHLVHPKAHGDRRIDIQCLTGNALDFFAIQYAQSAHVVQSVSQFDKNDADIPRHSQRHFLEVLSLSELNGVELHMSEFADTVYQLSNFLAKLRANIFFVDAGILYNVMQQCCH